MSEKSDKKMETTLKVIFEGMDKLAEHPFEYYVFGISAFMLIVGILIPPWQYLTREELWAISIFGFLGLLGSIYVWRTRASFRMRINEEKIAYKKFRIEQRTLRYKILEQPEPSPFDDLEDI